MLRRTFLLGAAATAAGCTRSNTLERAQRLYMPGMLEGHVLRDGATLPAASHERKTSVAILGSGVAGLSCAWKLAKQGFHDFVVVAGPEFGGNSAGGGSGDLAYPRGAHYLPLPSMASTHVREMLADFGVLTRHTHGEHPYYDERAIVHSPDERVLHNGKWEEGVLPSTGLSVEVSVQHQTFLAEMERLRTLVGADGKKVFCIPIALSSNDPEWRALDALTFKQWLDNNGYTSPGLHWYASYCCRDDYGADYDLISAWAGLHYFASRDGHAANAADGAVLTWPNGLATLIEKLHAAITRRLGHSHWRQDGMAMKVTERPGEVQVTCARVTAGSISASTLRAKRVVCATPLFVASRLLPDIRSYGFDPAIHLPQTAPWLVSNFSLSGYPVEAAGEPLAWDNVVYRGRGLGYVVSTHQLLRAAPSPRTVFTAYDALSQGSPDSVRRWMMRASPAELREQASTDLVSAYGRDFWVHATDLEITLRGHGMASPLQGFLDNRGTAALREVDGPVLFAHADLSGYSVFEEASWWGVRAADRILGA